MIHIEPRCFYTALFFDHYEKNCHFDLWARQQYAGSIAGKFALRGCGCYQ
jgi:hypothetical protein